MRVLYAFHHASLSLIKSEIYITNLAILGRSLAPQIRCTVTSADTPPTVEDKAAWSAGRNTSSGSR